MKLKEFITWVPLILAGIIVVGIIIYRQALNMIIGGF